ncbi:sigma-70 family RNA polymerase sigma factor [Rhodococcus aerolatus]
MSHPGDELDEALVAAAVRGERAALSRVLAVVRPVLVRYCRARVGPAGVAGVSADDVAQEVCLAVLTALPRYRDQGRPFMAFVYGIAAHKVADVHRSGSRSRSDPVAEVPEEPTPEQGPEQRALDADAAARVAELLDVLPERQREVVVLRLVVGMSAEETASTLGSTAGAVRVAQHRALARLREELAARDGDTDGRGAGGRTTSDGTTGDGGRTT